nr:hypothetical protein [Tanacetum cinerariifolium]
GVEVLADIDAQHAAVLGGLHATDQVVDAQVVETHAVDDALGMGQTEDPWLGITRLRTRRDSADFNETETQLSEPVDRRTVLVQPGG